MIGMQELDACAYNIVVGAIGRRLGGVALEGVELIRGAARGEAEGLLDAPRPVDE